MECKDIQELLSEYGDGEIAETELQQVKAHISVCGDCRQMVADQQTLKGMFREYFQRVNTPLQMEQIVLQQIRRSRQDAQVLRLTMAFLALIVLISVGIVGIMVSPIGALVRGLLRVFFTVVQGGLYTTSTMGHLWYSVVVAFCIILAGVSLFGVMRLMRAVNDEVYL